jgi:hypothetical protein
VDVIRDHQEIRKKLKERLEELGVNLSAVIEDAQKRNRTIQMASLVRYMSGERNGRSTITQEDLLWLCSRYKIKIELFVTKLPYGQSKISAK